MITYLQTQVFMKRLLPIGLSFIFALVATVAYAQPKIQFNKTKHAFGTIKEDGGLAQVTFSFKNTGNQTLKLTNVKASCGCTTPTWTKAEIKPGGSGVVKAAFNPMGRVGAFNKSITVRSNAQPAVSILQISGKVTPRKKGPKDWYPVALGNLRFKSNTVWFGDIMHDSKNTEKSTFIYNDGNDPITLNLAATKLPKHVQIVSVFEAKVGETKVKKAKRKKKKEVTIKPKQAIGLTFAYNATEKKDWDYVYDSFMLITDDKIQAKKRMSVGGYIKEKFSKKALLTPPAAKFDKTTHSFGTMKQNARASATFKISNEGKSTLYIRKTKASCGCTATKPKKKVLAPGESTTIGVTYSSGTSKGRINKSVTVITNDPKKPKTVLSITADVSPSAKPKK
ncbi:conserved hypothetical protein [Microscilla marina ATCC 23134]|uniref:DUF1573 domain-containing protein n=2 Tax=Microscilla marina TaxID=1027 RepID=A1ZYY6_MICM2|nr:conserved hypothetical protein [Microscilla marina ATCC 23134]